MSQSQEREGSDVPTGGGVHLDGVRNPVGRSQTVDRCLFTVPELVDGVSVAGRGIVTAEQPA